MSAVGTSEAPRLQLANLLPDMAAGLCVAGLLLPEAVAYSGLAHLPVAHALVASLVALLIYAAFGGSRFAVVAPTSSTATFSAAAALSLPSAASDPAAYITAVVALVLVAGAVLMVLAVARQGQLSAYVSRPVLRGFAFALAITIVIKQLPDATGLALPHGMASDPFHILAYMLAHLGQSHLPSLAVAAFAAVLVAGLKRWPRIPALMVVLVIAIGLAWKFDLKGMGVEEVGAVERPSFLPVWPQLSVEDWMRVAELAVGLVVLVFAESWGSVRSLALAHGDRIDANRELMVLGACNAAAALMQGMAVGAGFSASSANAAAGAQSRLAGFMAVVVMALALAFAMPWLPLLPRPVLAVAVIAALWHALSPKPIVAVWHMRRDRTVVLIAIVAVLMLGVLHGMLVAIALSLADAMRRFSEPVVHELGELGATRNFVVLKEHPEAIAQQRMLVLRPEEPLFFASAERVVSAIVGRAQSRVGLASVVLSLEESADMDSTAVECLMELRQQLLRRNIDLALARVKQPVRELLARVDPQGLGLDSCHFWSVSDAVAARQALAK